MEKKRTIQRTNGKRKGRPKVRFNFGMLLVIFILSFAACFILYMLAANFNADFFQEEFDSISDIVPGEDNAPGIDDAEETTVPEATAAAEKEITNPVPQSAAADLSYLDTCCLVTDSSLLDMAQFSGLKSVIGSKDLGAANCNTLKVESSFGTVTVYETLKIKKPTELYIMLGSDLGTSSVEEMMTSYTTLVNNLKSSLPEMNIYIMQIPPTIYDTESVTNEKINEYNNNLLNMANSAGVYCIDTNTALKSGEGTLAEEYWDYETLALNEEAYKTISNYILTHVG